MSRLHMQQQKRYIQSVQCIDSPKQSHNELNYNMLAFHNHCEMLNLNHITRKAINVLHHQPADRQKKSTNGSQKVQQTSSSSGEWKCITANHQYQINL